jgi:hypothetical protein
MLVKSFYFHWFDSNRKLLYQAEHVSGAESGAEQAEKLASGTFEKREEREIGERQRSGERAGYK